MAPKRPSTPPRDVVMEMTESLPWSSPKPPETKPTGAVIRGPEHALIPPSPGIQAFENVNQTIGSAAGKIRARVSAGIQKANLPKRDVFRFLDLPGEIRNMIYSYTHSTSRQALLVHRPRLASLRSRTRFDRARPLASEITGHEYDKTLSLTKRRRLSKPNTKPSSLARESNRPFYGLTQVCQLVRAEYLPLYLYHQEIGMDLTGIVNYLRTFYADAEKRLDLLGPPGSRQQDAPFTGNLTIAVGDKVNATEGGAGGVDIFPLLEIWANSYKIEAGFGRYHTVGYAPENDGEAKDLYRLFGRRVLHNRTCSSMNGLWRSILRNRALAAVRIHRKPAAPAKPYIHLIFKKDFAEPWMTQFESVIPMAPAWLYLRGFYFMEHFEIRVGVEQ